MGTGDQPGFVEVGLKVLGFDELEVVEGAEEVEKVVGAGGLGGVDDLVNS